MYNEVKPSSILRKVELQRDTDLSRAPRIDRLSQVVVKLTGRCNLNCNYCYLYKHGDQSYRDRPSAMSNSTYYQLLSRIREYISPYPDAQIEIALHGGEPTLVGSEKISRFADTARTQLGERLNRITLQTNGTLIDGKLCNTLLGNRISVGLSIDGPRRVHDGSRQQVDQDGSYEAAIRGLKLLQDHGLAPGALCVVNPETDGQEIYEHLRELDLEVIDFLLPDATHDSKPRVFPNLQALSVGKYLQRAFDAWFREDNGNVEVRLFSAVLMVLLGGRHTSDQIGHNLLSHVVIETDGSIQPDDGIRICLDDRFKSWANISHWRISDATDQIPILRELTKEGLPHSASCLECPEYKVCGGGYPPHRYSSRNGFSNPSIWCADVYDFIRHVRKTIRPFYN